MHAARKTMVTRLAMLLSLTALLFAGSGIGAAASGDAVTVDTIADILENQKIPQEPFTALHFDLLVAKAQATGATKVLIPPGVHYIDRTLRIEKANNLTIDAQGATLMFTHRNQALRIENSSDLVIKDLTIDYDPLPFTQGVVVDIAQVPGWVDVRIDDGYPLDDELMAWFHNRELQVPIIDPEKRTFKYGVTPLKAEGVDLIEGRLVRIHTRAIDDISNIEVGDSLVLKYRGGHSIRIEGSENVHFDNVTLYSSPNMGIVEANGNGGNRYEVTIEPGPRPKGAVRDRLQSTNADGFHSNSMVRGPIIENSRFVLNGDSNLNIHGYYSIIVAKPESDVLIVSPNTEGTLGAGDLIEIYTGREIEMITSARVVEVEDVFSPEYVEEARRQWHGRWGPENIITRVFHRVKLDRPVDVAIGDLVSSMDRAGNGSIIRNSHFQGIGKAINFAGNGALIENNVIIGSGASAIALIAEGYWLTGPFPRDVVIRGNTMLNIGVVHPARISQNQDWGAISVYKRPQNLYDPRPGIREIRNIVIEDNYLEGSAFYGIMIGNTSGATIRRNTIVNKSELAPEVLSQPYSLFTLNSGIFLFETDNIVIEDNVIEHVPAHGIYVLRSHDIDIVGENRVIGHAEDVIHKEAVAIALNRASNVKISEFELVDPTDRIVGVTTIASSDIELAETNLELIEGAELAGEDASLTPYIYDDFYGDVLDASLWDSELDRQAFVRVENGTLYMTAPTLATNLVSTMELSGDKYAVSAKVHSVEQGAVFLGFITEGANARVGLQSGGRAFADANIGGVFDRFLHSYPGTLDPSTENELLLERDGDVYRVYINGVLAIEKEMPGFPTEGVKILVQTWTASRNPNDGVTGAGAWTEIRYGVHED